MTGESCTAAAEDPDSHLNAAASLFSAIKFLDSIVPCSMKQIGANMSSPYSIDNSKMRNALMPSVPSRLQYYYGNDEVQLEILKGSMLTDDLNSDNIHSYGFNMETRVFNNYDQLDKGVYSLPSQSYSMIYDNNHQPGNNPYGISSSNDISQQSLLLDKNYPSLPQYEGVTGNARKRPLEYVDNMSLWKKMKTNSKSKITLLEPKWYQATRKASEIIPEHKLHVPIRRNQKISDKITTLQKLVSPFGKTDTASVLHEASLYIKHLQAQIQTLFQMLSFSHTTTVNALNNQECGDKMQVDLRSRGLCLVPISITQKVTVENQINHASTSRRIILPRNF